MTVLTNEVREKHSVNSKVAFNPELSYVSRDWSIQQDEDGTISHKGFPKERVNEYKDSFPEKKVPSMRGENVAYNYSNSEDPKEIAEKFVTMWENSEGHLRNMINSSHTLLGAGVYFSEDRRNRIYATQIFAK